MIQQLKPTRKFILHVRHTYFDFLKKSLERLIHHLLARHLHYV